MVGALGTESHTAGHLCVGPNFALKRLNLENFVLEKHLVLFDCLSDAHVFAIKRGNGSLLAPLHLLLGLSLIIRVI